MKNKYKNIFWHQGVKLYDPQEIETSKRILSKVEHLENDVTKSLLNVLEQTSKSVISEFVKVIARINNSHIILKKPEYDFQITDRKRFRRHKKQFLLKLISQLTPEIPMKKEFRNKSSIPDGVIFDNSCVVLIEAKTQSPLDKSQIKRHIRNYIPKATEINLTWESVYDLFMKLSPRLIGKDSYLLNQFCEYLALIGLSSLHKFTPEDFEAFAYNYNANAEELLQQHRSVSVKLEKLRVALWNEWGKRDYAEYKKSPVKKNADGLWFGFYSHKDKANHTNLNFTLSKEGFYIDVNAELRESFNRFLNKIEQKSSEFDLLTCKISVDYHVELYTKLPLKPESANHFYWKKIDTLSADKTSAAAILNKVKHIEKKFNQYKAQMIKEVEANREKYSFRDTVYVKKRYCGKNCNKMSPRSFCVIRFRHLINKDEAILLDRTELGKRVLKVSKAFKGIIDFANIE